MIPKVIFLQDIYHEQLGLEYLAGYLRSRGVECEVFIESGESDLIGILREKRPLIVGFSSTTGSHIWALRMAAQVKSALSCLVVMGGPHPTFYPQVIEDPNIDIIIRGEGEEAFYDLVSALEKGTDYTGIRNVWAKKDGKLHKNPIRPLIEDLDGLPHPDRSIYDRYGLIRRDTIKPLMAGRGCPYGCSYCFNISERNLYKGKGKYVRQRSVESVLSEIKEVVALYRPRVLNFIDDILGIDRGWLLSFLKLYEKDVRMPFLCNTRWELLNNELSRRFKSAGCWALQIGIESADEKMRKELLGRGATNREIIEKAGFLHEIGLKFRSYNMVALPGESIEHCFNTLELNSRIGTDYSYVAIFQPYPGTPLGDRAIREGWVKPDFINSIPATFHKKSLLSLEKPHRYENLHKLSLLIIRFPRLKRLWIKLISFPPNPLFQMIFLISTGIVYSRLTGRGLLRTISLGLRHLWYYRENWK